MPPRQDKHMCIEIYVETLNRGKPREHILHYINSGCTVHIITIAAQGSSRLLLHTQLWRGARFSLSLKRSLTFSTVQLHWSSSTWFAIVTYIASHTFIASQSMTRKYTNSPTFEMRPVNGEYTNSQCRNHSKCQTHNTSDHLCLPPKCHAWSHAFVRSEIHEMDISSIEMIHKHMFLISNISFIQKLRKKLSNPATTFFLHF